MHVDLLVSWKVSSWPVEEWNVQLMDRLGVSAGQSTRGPHPNVINLFGL
jgi:hypothetical protein